MSQDEEEAIQSSLWVALQELTNDTGFYRENLLEALDGKLSELRDEWKIETRWANETDKANTLTNARNIINSRLKLFMARLKVPKRVSGKKYFHAVLVEFNLPHELIKADLRKKDLTKRREWLAREAPVALRVSASTSYRYLKDAITQIEQQILSVNGDHDVEDTHNSQADSPYVIRHALHAEFTKLVDSGAKLVVIHGLAGMGKTWLATKLTEGSPVIPVMDGVIDNANLQAAIVDHRVDAQTLPQDLVGRLAALLCSTQAPRYVLLDGLESADDLVGLIPRSTRSIVVATCRDAGEAPPEHAAFIKVAQMSSDEAALMVRSHLPSLRDGEVRMLTRTLDNYPLVIRYACLLIKEQGLSATDFCSDLGSELKETTQRISTSDRETLLTVIKRSVARIGDKDILARKIVSLLATCVFNMLTRDLIWLWAKAWMKEYQGIELTPTRFVQAIVVLERYGITDIRHVGDDNNNLFDSIVIHALTSWLIENNFVGDDVSEVITCWALLYRDSTRGSIAETIRHISLSDRTKIEPPDSLLDVLRARSFRAVTIHGDPGGWNDYLDAVLLNNILINVQTTWFAGRFWVDEEFLNVRHLDTRTMRILLECLAVNLTSHKDPESSLVDRLYRFPAHWFVWTQAQMIKWEEGGNGEASAQ